MAKLTSKERNKLPDEVFAGPNRSYPIHDRSHARAALAMSARHASPYQQKKIKKKVGERYPEMFHQTHKNATFNVKASR